MIYVQKYADKGRGVFTDSPISKDTLIERCPVIEIPALQSGHIDVTVLYDYYFGWGQDNQEIAIALGYGSLYNHSFSPNAVYVKNLSDQTIDYVALRDIEPGEEILVNYNGDPDNHSPLWKSDQIDWKE
jgi:SET domain-containing protein